jgi:hypothetical protein
MLSNEQVIESGIRELPYQFIYEYTRAKILALSGLSEERLEGIATELDTDIGTFLMDYKGPYLVDDHAYFVEMLQQWPTPWEVFDHAELEEMGREMCVREGWLIPPGPGKAWDEIGLNGLTVAQFFLAWAWDKNNAAKHLFSAEANASGWSQESALSAGIRAAVSTARSLMHAEALMASGENKLGQKAL